MGSEVTPVEVPPMECPAVMLPTPANMKNMIKQIAAMPAKILAMLEVEAETAAGLSDEVKAQIEDLRTAGRSVVLLSIYRRGQYAHVPVSLEEEDDD